MVLCSEPATQPPFGGALERINGAGYPFVMHYTITGYPGALDLATRPAEAAITDFQALSRLLGVRRLIWRYDPVLIGSIRPKA